MEPERLPELLEQALALGAGAGRDAFLASLDPDLRRELASLIDAAAASGDFLEEPALFEAVELVPDLLGSALEGETIGAWHLQALLHSGGMGSVFRAERVGEDFSQRAAFKLVKVGFESADLVERFTRERQLLAGLEHPNIARLLDGGTTAEGRPWLAMDFIDGEAIDTWADRERLTIAERLVLFDQVLDAIANLHENLITHRDLKAPNVLVDGRGQVKVLDFGIASLLGEPLDEAPEERRLSLATAAPEQLRPGAISTATDVYALGALLYKLLAGVPPYRITRDLEPREIEILICERVPPPASTAAAASEELDGIAAARRSSGPHLLRGLRGDLDAILARALQKAPRDRYRSVAELREDLRSCLDKRPVSARAPSPAYRTQKFVRRHWRGLTATTVTMLALAAGLGLALWQAGEARRQADRAEAMNSFMQEVLAEADPFQAGADKRVRDILAEASARLDRRFADKPLLEAALRQSIGGVQLSLLDTGNAEANLMRALELLETRLPDDDELRLRTESHLAWLANEREDYEASITRYRALIDRLTPAHEAELRAQLHNDFAVVLNHTDQHERAIGHLEQAMVLAPDAPGRSATLVNLGYAYDGLNELETSKDYYRRAIERLRAQGKDGEVADLAYAINNYGNVLSQQGREDQALPWYLESLEVRKRVFGPESDAVAIQHLNIGRLLLDMQRPGEALPHLGTATELLPRYREADSIYRRVARGSLARAQLLATDDPQTHDQAREILAAVVIDLQNDADMRESRFTVQFSEWLAAAQDGPD